MPRGQYIAREAGIHVDGDIFIGQGYQNKTLEGIGIGKCCRGADKCVMGCPPTADMIVRAFQGRSDIIGIIRG